MIQLEINGEKRIFEGPLTLSTLLQQLQIREFHIAIAVNRSIVSRSQFEKMQLKTGDHVEIVKPMGGG